MKNLIITFVIFLTLISCTEVVDIPLDTENPRLVVEANIKWQNGTSGEEQSIKLTTTTNFYTKTIPKALGAIVSVKNNATNEVFAFIETPNSGLYNCNNFKPVINDTYTINIKYKDTEYQATEKLISVSEIVDVIQEANGGLNGKKIRVRAVYNDPQPTADYYLFNYSFPNLEGMKPDFYVSDDIFYNGNQFYSVSFKDDLKVGDIVKMTHLGISQQYYNYLNILLSLAGSGGGGGPFSAPPVSVRGNFINNQNENDYPYGYFSLSQIDSKEYVIK